jgi:hypothetical protein
MAKVKPTVPKANESTELVPIERVERSILLIRGQRVLLDVDLATVYGVAVKRLNEAVQRNLDRFPGDFMFRLTRQEFDNLRSQFATSRSWGGRRYPPNAFTEHGAVMLASVLSSAIAIEASVQVVRAFVRLRQMIFSNEKMRRKLSQIERKLQDHDQHFAAVFDVIRQLMDEEDSVGTKRPRIGYDTEAKPHE